MHVNKLAGRSFNDLTQYPVMPFVLKDYTSEELDIDNPNVYVASSPPETLCVTLSLPFFGF